jgi:hypothetical protein
LKLNKIVNFNLINNTINDFGWYKCRFINGFRFFIDRNKNYEEISKLEIVFEYVEHERYLITVHFKELGPYELRTGGSRIQLSSFQINDIRDRGWNELNYEMTDCEMDGGIKFYCKDIEIISIDMCK